MDVIPYQKFIKHAEKVTKEASSTSGGRLFKGINHLEDGKVEVTDTYRLYKAKTTHNLSGIYDVEGKEIDGKFPDFSSIFSEPKDAKAVVALKATPALEAVKTIQQAGAFNYEGKKRKSKDKKSTILQIQTDGFIFKSVELENFVDVKCQSEFILTVEEKQEDFKDNIFLNSQFLIDALTFFKDLGIELIPMYLYGYNKPIYFPFDGLGLWVIILPIKKEV